MLVLKHDGLQLVLEGEYLDRDVAKTINGVVARGANKWLLTAAVPTYVEASRVVKEDGGVVDETAKAWWAKAQRGIDQLLDLKTGTPLPATLGGFELRDYQEQDARFLSTLRSGLILNDMRTGKSATLFRTLDLLDAFPALIAVPPSTTFEMEAQARKAFPGKSIAALSSGLTAPQRKKIIATNPDILILGHNLVGMHAKLLGYGGLPVIQREKERKDGKYEEKELDEREWKAIVCDEAHLMSNPKSVVTRALWQLGDKSKHRFALTGTPAPNSEPEMWALIRFCFPLLFPAKSKWINRYVEMVPNRFGIMEARGYRAHTKADWDLVFSLMHVRRMRTAGPEQEFRTIPVELSKQQAKVYKQFAEHSMALLGDDLVAATDTMTLSHRLRQATGGMPVVRDDEIKALELPSSKIDALLALREEAVEKTIVVCVSRLLVDLVVATLADKGVKVAALVGGMKPAARQKACEDFQTGDAEMIIINQAGVQGIELSAAKRTVFLERSYDLTHSAQAEARNTSQAQTAQTVEIIDIVAKNTIDEAVYSAYASKDENLHKRLNDKEWLKRSLYGVSGEGS